MVHTYVSALIVSVIPLTIILYYLYISIVLIAMYDVRGRHVFRIRTGLKSRSI